MIGADTTFLVELEIREMPRHATAHQLLHREVLEAGVELALAPQVLTEFLQIVTDPRRFERPLNMSEALSKANVWWSAREVRHVYPTAESTALFLGWLGQHGLGW